MYSGLEGEPVNPITFGGVSVSSLGAMLKGYGIVAVVGEQWPRARFWWNETKTLVAQFGEVSEGDLLLRMEERLRTWAENGPALKDISRLWNDKELKKDWRHRRNVVTRALDTLSASAADIAATVAIQSDSLHPLYPGFGKYGTRPEANYFAMLSNLPTSSSTLGAAVFGNGSPLSKKDRKGGGPFFPDAIKRYATGAKWVHQNDGPVSDWEVLLTLRGALLLRGAARAPRGSRHSYPAFPFVFSGTPKRIGGTMMAVEEFHLPTWTAERPRTLGEFKLQVRQFQARVGRTDFAATAADFRRAVRGRGVAGAFDAFHRFVLEPRKPGQRRPQVQAIARGTTRVGRPKETTGNLRLLLAPLDDSGWLDQFSLRRESDNARLRKVEELALARSSFDNAVHTAVDHPTSENYLSILQEVWHLQRRLLEVKGPEKFVPAPPLPAAEWEPALAQLFDDEPEARLARALASVGWVPSLPATPRGDRSEEVASCRPLVEQLIPAVWQQPTRRFQVPDRPPAARIPWRGLQPEMDFAQLFWRRWLDTLQQPEFPMAGTRTASLADIASLLWGELNVRRLHEVVTAFLVFDWSDQSRVTWPMLDKRRPLLPTYAALRLWTELGARPRPDARRPLDGEVARGLVDGTNTSVARACKTALRRLRIAGLPGISTPEEPRPSRRAVADPDLSVERVMADRLALATMIPIGKKATEKLARLLLVPERQHIPSSQRENEEESHG